MEKNVHFVECKSCLKKEEMKKERNEGREGKRKREREREIKERRKQNICKQTLNSN